MALTDNIISYYKLDGNSNDSVGSNDGSDTSITYSDANGIINNGAGFNGSSSVISVGDIDSNYLTVSAWVKQVVGEPTAFVYKWYDGTIRSYRLDATAGKYRWEISRDGLETLQVRSTTDYDDGSWVHLVGTYDGTYLKIYYNGSLETTSSTLSGTIYNNSESTTIGITAFEGAIDEVGIWSRAITSTEVTALYNSGSGFQPIFSSIKSINGLAKASIKSRNGLAIADIKSINGLE